MKKETLSLITGTVDVLNMDIDINSRVKLESIFMAAAKDGFKGPNYEVLRDLMVPYAEALKTVEGSEKEVARDLVLPHLAKEV